MTPVNSAVRADDSKTINFPPILTFASLVQRTDQRRISVADASSATAIEFTSAALAKRRAPETHVRRTTQRGYRVS